MAGPKSLPTHARLDMDRVIREAGELDRRRQRQIANQLDIINRLLATKGIADSGETADLLSEMADKVGTAEAKIEAVNEVLKRDFGGRGESDLANHMSNQLIDISRITGFDE